MSNTIITNYTKIRHQMPHSKSDITIVGATKTQTVDTIRQVYQIGVKNIGENYVREAIDKICQLHYLNIVWHFIGRIQSNKCQLIAHNFDWVQTVASFKHAQLLSQYRVEKNPLQILIQVNIDNEIQKNGISPEQIFNFAQQIVDLKNIDLRGIMLIPKAQSSSTGQTFKQCQNIFLELQKRFATVDTLSMGMSNDFALAIENGATMIRLGTGLFGSRVYSNP